uniref:Metallo-beta-lactamase domain-containing protein 1 n=1 Tax=Globodera rostochiensis TaxID=31243 RepID=A0A914GVQ2_GLORO
MFMPLLYAAAPQILSDLNFGVNVTSPQFRHRLRDFIGRSGATTSSSRRGKGSISRLAIDGTDPLQLPDPDMNTMDDVLLNEDDKLTRMDAPNFQPFQIVMPSNVRKTEHNYFVAPAKNSSIVEAPDKMPEDYEKLAKFLQRFVSLQQNKKILNQNSMNITPKMQNLSKQTPAAEGGGIGDEHHAKFKFGNAASTNSAARGTVIGTVPVSVDIGHDDGMEQSSFVPNGNILPADEMKPPHSKAMDKAYKLEQKGQEKGTDSVRSWDGRVEKVTTLKMTPSSASAAVTASASASADDNANIGQPVQKQQLLGRIMVATNKNNSAAGNMEREEEDQSFFYQVPNKNGNIDNAIVEILREGFARQLDDTEYVFVASITLISDGGKTILVDTGMGTDINGRTDLIKKLSQRNIAPPAVNYVVITHGHPDHSGNTNDFPDAIHFQGVMSHYRTKFNFTDLFENAKHQLTKNVALFSTPGHTSEDISVVVKNAHGYGTVVVSGDVFITEQNRRIILCMADFVVPGHGQMFRVSAKVKRRANCSNLSDLQHTEHA